MICLLLLGEKMDSESGQKDRLRLLTQKRHARIVSEINGRTSSTGHGEWPSERTDRCEISAPVARALLAVCPDKAGRRWQPEGKSRQRSTAD